MVVKFQSDNMVDGRNSMDLKEGHMVVPYVIGRNSMDLKGSLGGYPKTTMVNHSQVERIESCQTDEVPLEQALEEDDVAA
ncbi:hypothetical protein LR48_Vigan03g029400 [Vigna angularis]|uniref:Uncharacterized protein n=1 Tax=Phaseolus angularis TaxID=3914 RepID=A0A0L9U260_PHAAN|nr:hypothetical protein LR48_Vigan03g029400 [Vigna angularis]